jgi:excinuclease ABC subunit C
MPIHELKEQIGRLPEQPGVYLYFNEDGDTIYVGKARALRDRVRNYLGAYGSDAKTDALLEEVVRLEVIVTDSVVEALALENNLIKQRTPKYNILLRDDKNYPFLQLTTNEAFPRVLVARGVQRDGSFYAGPFMPAHFARKTMSLTHRLFGMRSCNEVITGQARASVPRIRHQTLHRAVRRRDLLRGGLRPRGAGRALFLEGQERRARQDTPRAHAGCRRARTLRGGRAAARCLAHGTDAARSSAEDGDRGARTPRCVRLKLGPRASPFRSSRCAAVASSSASNWAPTTRLSDRARAEVLEAAIQQFYELRGAPAEIYVPAEPADRDALETWLSNRVDRKVRIIVPQRGDKRSLVDLANRNAALAYQTRFNQTQTAQYDGLETLQHVLALPALPRRIECFDISTIQGSETVASMVVCEGGRMRRSEYRQVQDQGRREQGLGARG